MRFDGEMQELQYKIRAAIMKAKVPSVIKLAILAAMHRAIVDYSGQWCDMCMLYYDTPECPRCHGMGG